MDDDARDRAAALWKHRGGSRPTFAEPVGPGQESVWDYPRPPRLERSTKTVSVEFGGLVIAETRRAYRVLETASPPTWYLPLADMRHDCLVDASGTSFCEWKGLARYHHVRVGGRVAERAAWSYATPAAPFEALEGHVGVYPGRVDRCTVDGERVRPQPGEFYAGWVTSDVVGPFKGEPGTGGW